MTITRYNVGMKTKNEIEIKKVRKQLQKYTISKQEKESLRERLVVLKEMIKREKKELVE